MCEIRKFSSISRFEHESQKKVASLPSLGLDSRSRFSDLSFHSQLCFQVTEPGTSVPIEAVQHSRPAFLISIRGPASRRPSFELYEPFQPNLKRRLSFWYHANFFSTDLLYKCIFNEDLLVHILDLLVKYSTFSTYYCIFGA